MNTIKTIDIVALEWFDKVNGNSYFAGTVTVNFGMPDEAKYKMPLQYGYGDHYVQQAYALLKDNGVITDMGKESNWEWAKRNGVIVRKVKHENCLKRELKAI